MERVRLPRADHRLVLTLEDHHPVETNLSTELFREFVPLGVTVAPLEFTLSPSSEVPDGMVPVPGGDYLLSSPDAPTTHSESCRL